MNDLVGEGRLVAKELITFNDGPAKEFTKKEKGAIAGKGTDKGAKNNMLELQIAELCKYAGDKNRGFAFKKGAYQNTYVT
jgi:hypothetical protein